MRSSIRPEHSGGGHHAAAVVRVLSAGLRRIIVYAYMINHQPSRSQHIIIIRRQVEAMFVESLHASFCEHSGGGHAALRSCVVPDRVERNHILVSTYTINHQSSRSLHTIRVRRQVEEMFVKILQYMRRWEGVNHRSSSSTTFSVAKRASHEFE
jgi:hypothetical protein